MKNIFKQFKNGFTLAEVLITLVIIGVIAALTIPTAINKSKEQERKTQFAKAYSTFAQALKKTVMNDFFGYADCSYYVKAENNAEDYSKTANGECRSFYNAFVKNLQVQKVCLGNAKADGCIPEYDIPITGTGCGGFSKSNIENLNDVYVLNDGTIIITYGTNSGMPLFLFDINGHKGPNAYGKDVFSLKIARKSNELTGFYLDSNACDYPVSGGRSTKKMIQYALAGIE